MQHALTDQFVRVIVQAPLGPLDYRVDEATEVAVGDRVLVTLGTRQVVGIVVDVTAVSVVESRKLKRVLRVLGETEPFRREWLELMRFTANYYIRTWGEAALSSLPRFFRLPPRARRQASLNRIREIPPIKTEGRPTPRLNAEQYAAFGLFSVCSLRRYRIGENGSVFAHHARGSRKEPGKSSAFASSGD